jgi:hypothetical protein
MELWFLIISKLVDCTTNKDREEIEDKLAEEDTKCNWLIYLLSTPPETDSAIHQASTTELTIYVTQ